MKKYIYSIWACFNGKWKKVDDTYNKNNAYYLLREYSMAYGKDTPLQLRHHGEILNY